MTLNEFLKRLAKTPRGWYLNHADRIRLVGAPLDHCPISAVTMARGDYHSPVTAGERKLKLKRITAERIVNAADHRGLALNNNDASLRRRLLKACGLPADFPASS